MDAHVFRRAGAELAALLAGTGGAFAEEADWFKPADHSGKQLNLAVNASLPVKDIKEFIAYIKKNPGKVNYGSAGAGSLTHLTMELLKQETGAFMLHIPYRGIAPAINDVLAGQVAVYFDQVASSLPHINSGKVKALAVSWPQRLDVLPDVPTYGELGHAANNDPSWFGLVAPAGTPAAAVDRIQQAVAQALQEPDVRERLARQGLYPSGTTPKAFTTQIAREIDKMKGVAAFAKVSLD